MLETNSRLQSLANRSPDLYHLTDEDLGHIHGCLSAMLSDIDRVCNEYSLCYCLYAGTMLGAVRHGGFIPWDDDLDLCMPRKDYDRFAEIFSEECSGNYWVQEVRRDPSYDLSFMKVRRKGTLFREFTEPDNDKAGLFIDIFPLENVPDRRFLRGLYTIACDGLFFICSCVRISKKKTLLLKYCEGTGPGMQPGQAEDIGADTCRERASLARQIRMKAAIGRIFGMIPLHSWLVLTDRAASLCKNERSRYVSIPSGKRHARGERCLRASMLPTVPTVFVPEECRSASSTTGAEERYFPGCAYPDAVLRILYGDDYMQLPPPEQREHHSLLEYRLPQEDGISESLR